jgi:hypothetical protein
MKKNFKMSTRVIDEQANTLKFGPKMPLLSGVSFKGFDKSESIIIFRKVNNLSWFLVDMLVMFIPQVAKKDGSLYPPMKYAFFILLF